MKGTIAMVPIACDFDVNYIACCATCLPEVKRLENGFTVGGVL